VDVQERSFMVGMMLDGVACHLKLQTHDAECMNWCRFLIGQQNNIGNTEGSRGGQTTPKPKPSDTVLNGTGIESSQVDNDTGTESSWDSQDEMQDGPVPQSCNTATSPPASPSLGFFTSMWEDEPQMVISHGVSVEPDDVTPEDTPLSTPHSTPPQHSTALPHSTPPHPGATAYICTPCDPICGWVCTG